MPVIYTPPAPWAGPYPQAVLDNFGNNWVAFGPNQIKRPAFTLETVDCCHYQSVEVSDIDPDNPPTTPADPAGADKSQGDTLHVSHNNGSCYYTCLGGIWSFDFCKVEAETPDDCCHYQVAEPGDADPAAPPAAPPSDPAGDDKSDGDTLNVGYDNGSCFYTCVDGAWALDFCQLSVPADDCCHYQMSEPGVADPAAPPAAPPSDPAGDDKSDGDTLNVGYDNGSCFYTCVDGDWELDFCNLSTAADDCCHYLLNDGSTADPAAPPAAPPSNPAGDDKSEGDTLTVGYANGSCHYECDGTDWVLVFCNLSSAADDCCHYLLNDGNTVDPAAPPAAPPSNPAGADKSVGDTLTVGHANGTCHYECDGTDWVLAFCNLSTAADDCCHYLLDDGSAADPAAPPATPPSNPAGDDKSAGDTLTVGYSNGTCHYECDGTDWVLVFCSLSSASDDCCHYHLAEASAADPAAPPATPPSNPAGADKSAGDTLVVGYTNGTCHYTCDGTDWVLDFCQLSSAGDDCCHYQQVEVGVIDPAAPPVPTDPAGADKSDGDTLQVRYDNGSAYYTCDGGAWVFDFCEMPSPDISTILCNTPSRGILRHRTTNIKTGVETDQDFSAVQKCSAGTFYNTNEYNSEFTQVINLGQITIDLPCEQQVIFNSQYDIIVRNISGVIIPGTQHGLLYSYVNIDGASGAGLADNWLTVSDAPWDQFSAQDGVRQGELNIAGNACVTIPAGVHTVDMILEQWRAGDPNLLFDLSQANIQAAWTEMECK